MKLFDKLINGGEKEDIVMTPEVQEEVSVEQGQPSVQEEEPSLGDVEPPKTEFTEQEVIKEKEELKESPVLSEQAQVEGSLTPMEPQIEQDSVLNVPESSELSDQDIFNHLSEKLGKEVKSYDDLSQEGSVNQFETDTELKALVEWKEKTGRPLSDWVNYQKDYESMSNIEVAREILQHRHSDLTDAEISLDLQKYIPDEDDSDSEGAIKSLNLKKFASQGRRELNDLKLEFDSPLPASSALTPEQREDLDFASQVKSEMSQNQKTSDQYDLKINDTVKAVKSLPIKLSDSLSVNYNLTDVDRREVPGFLKDMPHWNNEDGSRNHDAIVSDATFIKNKDVITKLIYQQGLAAGKEQLMRETNNTTIGTDARNTVGSNVVGNESKVIIEGAEGMYGGAFGKPVGKKKLFS
jgi:hypothetical protein